MLESFYLRHGKRCFDAGAAFAGLLLFAPAFALIALAVRLDSTGPAFFRQVRTGRNGVPFRIVKFRSMRVVHAANPVLITASGDPRITRVGRILRMTKADELPQLFNVLLGDMSLVGPRPEVPKYTETYSPEQQGVLTLRPGITGPTALACVNEEEMLRQQADQEQFYKQVLLPAKLRMDLAYCENVRWASDLRYIGRTVSRVLARNRSLASPITNLQRNLEDLQA